MLDMRQQFKRINENELFVVRFFLMALILFDYDGVLADTLDDLLQFGQEACNELSVDHVITHDDLNNLEYMSFATYARECDVPENMVEDFVQYCVYRYANKNSPPAMLNGVSNIVQLTYFMK